MDKKKTNSALLAIMYYFPPMGSVCVNRTYPFLHGLAGKGLKVHVIRPKNISIPNQRKYDYEAFESIHPVSNYDYRWIKAKRFKTVHGNPLTTKTSYFNLIFVFLESLLGAFTIGEGGGIYLIQSYRKAVKLIKKQNIKYLYTSYRPLSDMLVAYLLKKRFPHLHWVADMRDYYLRYDTRNYLSKKLRIRLFKILLAESDTIMTVSKGIANKMKTEIGKDVKVVPNGINTYDQDLPASNRKFTLSYTGSLYDFYDPNTLLSTLKTWLNQYQLDQEQVELHYAGKDYDQWSTLVDQHQLSEISIIHGLVSSQTARDLQARSNINLMFSYASSEYRGVVTGKLYDLLGVHRPVLCLIHGIPDDDLNEYFHRLNLGKIFTTDSFSEEECIAFIHQEYEKWQRDGKIQRLDNHDLIQDFSWEKRLEDLYDYLCT